LAALVCGTTFIDRNRSEEARNGLENAIQAAKTDGGMKVAVFPEGTRHEKGVHYIINSRIYDRNHRLDEPSLLPFRTGAFFAAFSAGVAVLPVVIQHYDFVDADKKVSLFANYAIIVIIMERKPCLKSLSLCSWRRVNSKTLFQTTHE